MLVTSNRFDGPITIKSLQKSGFDFLKYTLSQYAN